MVQARSCPAPAHGYLDVKITKARLEVGVRWDPEQYLRFADERGGPSATS